MTKKTKEPTNVPIQDIISLTKQFIAIPSTANNIAAIGDITTLAGNELPDFITETFFAEGKPSLLIHNAQKDTKKFTIILNAHLDVVPGTPKQFIPYEQDGKLYGRGAYDMKAAAAVIILVFKRLASSISYPIALQITTDEEIGSNGAQKQVLEGYRADFLITGECGSNFRITNQAKGVHRVTLTAKGVPSHGAYPWLGDNAIIKLHNALDLIYKKYPIPAKESHATTVNITNIHTTNLALNRTPDHAEAYLDIRFIPEDHDIFSKISKLLPKDIVLETKLEYSPLNTSPNNSYIKLLQKIGQDILHQKVNLKMAHATSDIVRFAEAGCAGIEFGPIGGNQHNDNEWVDIKSLEDYYMILKNFLLEIDTQETMVK